MNSKLSKFVGIGLLFLTIALTTYSCQTAPPENPNKALAELIIADALDLWNNQNLSALDAHHHADFQRITPNGTVNGVDEYKTELQQTFQTWSDIKLEISEHWVADNVILMHWNWQGTNTGPLGKEIPATGKTMSVDGLSKTTIVDGKVKEDLLYWDRQKGNETLGFTLSPPVLADASETGGE